MAIELSSYTRPIKAALKRGKYACVYIAAIEMPAFCRIGYADDLVVAIGRLQRVTPMTVLVESALWLPDKGMAMTISKAVQCDLVTHLKPGGWFDAAPATVTAAVEMATFRIFPGVTLAWHDSVMSCWGSRDAVGQKTPT